MYCSKLQKLNRRSAWLLYSLLFLHLAGCSSIGPPTVTRDRFDYVNAISESYKRQTLLNLVKTRYVDAPVYMDIASVISQYEIGGELGFELAPSFTDNNLLLGNGKYADRPTITYTPVSGQKYSRSLLKPLPLSSIILLLQSGYPIDGIFHICVQSINGIQNRRSSALALREADSHFVDVLVLLRELQDTGNLFYQLGVAEEKANMKIGFRPTPNVATRNKQMQFRQLLALEPNAMEFTVVFGVEPVNNSELAVLSRSMTQVMIEYAADIDVPQSDVDEGRVLRSVSASTRKDFSAKPLIRVHNGVAQPADAHVSVFYRDKWYWVNDTDLYSKSTLDFLMILFSLTERGQEKLQTPIVTVPTY